VTRARASRSASAISTRPKTSVLRWLETSAASVFFARERFCLVRVEDRLTWGFGRSEGARPRGGCAKITRSPSRYKARGPGIPPGPGGSVGRGGDGLRGDGRRRRVGEDDAALAVDRQQRERVHLRAVGHVVGEAEPDEPARVVAPGDGRGEVVAVVGVLRQRHV